MLPSDANERKAVPVGTFLRTYFPDAIAELARLSWVANEQHNAGEPMHWAREKSTDHADCMIRHFLEAGTIDEDGMLHTAKMAWRALALLQLEIEEIRSEDEAIIKASGENINLGVYWICGLCDHKNTDQVYLCRSCEERTRTGGTV